MISDVIVVGSGPGGAVAAATLAEGGKSVLLVDRQSFPRDKVCGDGLPVEVMALLHEMKVDIRAAGLEYRRISSLSITGPGGRTVTVNESPRELFSMTAPRFSFDHVLHQHALKQGARFEVMNVHAPLLHNGRVVGVVERRSGQLIEHEARVVIAAGGVGSPIARALKGRNHDEAGSMAVAIRAYVHLKQPMPSCVHFFFQRDLLPGYAWIFPVSDTRANIGVYLHNDTYKQRGRNLREWLADFEDWLVEQGYDFELEPDSAKSWPLPIYTSSESRTTAGVLFVGDEGHFTNALTGGGIYTAMLTGRAAARQAVNLLDGKAMDYDAAWRSAVGTDLQRGRMVQQHVAGNARLFDAFLAAASAPLLRYPLMKAIAGDHY